MTMTPTEMLTDLYMRLTSRKFLVTVFALVFFILQIHGTQVNAELQNRILAVVLAFVGIEGTADVVSRFTSPVK